MHLFIKHTSAGLTINENDDPTVREDFANSFDRLIKEREPFYRHTIEGDDDMPAHIKASLVGFAVSIPITNHHLHLGIWQGDLSMRIPKSEEADEKYSRHSILNVSPTAVGARFPRPAFLVKRNHVVGARFPRPLTNYRVL